MGNHKTADQVYMSIVWLCGSSHNVIKELMTVSGYQQLSSLPLFSPFVCLTDPKAVQLVIHIFIAKKKFLLKTCGPFQRCSCHLITYSLLLHFSLCKVLKLKWVLLSFKLRQ